jgi:hypothetical protein
MTEPTMIELSQLPPQRRRAPSSNRRKQMLSDACSDFNSGIEKLLLEFKADLDRYSGPPFDYSLGEIPALQRGLSRVLAGEAGALDQLRHLAEVIRQFHDTPPPLEGKPPSSYQEEVERAMRDAIDKVMA